MTTDTLDYKKAKINYSVGIDYALNENFVVGFSVEKGSVASLKFTYKNNLKTSYQKYKYQNQDQNINNEDQYQNLITNLERNGIGVNKVIETANSIFFELTQFTHSNLQVVEEIIKQAGKNSGIEKDIKKNLKIVNLDAIVEFDDSFEENSNLIYEREKKSQFNTKTGLKFRPFIASREEFFKGALLLENDSEYIILDNLMLNVNLKYSLADNFDDLNIHP